MTYIMVTAESMREKTWRHIQDKIIYEADCGRTSIQVQNNGACPQFIKEELVKAGFKLEQKSNYVQRNNYIEISWA